MHACHSKHPCMTSRSIRTLRLPSSVRPAGSDAPAEIRRTYRRWGRLMAIYRDWKSRSEGDHMYCPIHLAWVRSFDCFLDDMGPCPQGNYSLMRRDPSGLYIPSNCFWGPRVRTGRKARLFASHQGETRAVTTWCARLGIPRDTVYSRIRRGLSPEAALGLTQECA